MPPPSCHIKPKQIYTILYHSPLPMYSKKDLLFLQGFFNCMYYNFQRLNTRIFFVIRLKYVPWCICGVCLLQHLFDSDLVQIPFFPVSPVFIRNFPLLLWRILTICKSGQLCILIYLNPEFYDYCAPV